MPERWPIDLPPLGPATMVFAGFDAEADRTDGVELAVSFAVGRGRVSIESSFATRLVDTVLGGGAIFSTARSAGPAERGVLAGVLAPAFDRIGGSLQPGPIAPRDGREREAAPISFHLHTAVASGWLRLMPPPGELGVGTDAAGVWRERAARLPVTGHVEIAATGVPASACAGVAVGDAIVFDGMRSSAFAPDGRWEGRLRVGGHVADLAVDVGGKVSIIGGFARLQNEEKNMSTSESNIDATTVLGAATIEIVAELGRVSLRGDELLGLAPGAVLSIGAGRTGISLRVGGEIWADGEIVDIDGELGVRVTRLASR